MFNDLKRNLFFLFSLLFPMTDELCKNQSKATLQAPDLPTSKFFPEMGVNRMETNILAYLNDTCTHTAVTKSVLNANLHTQKPPPPFFLNPCLSCCRYWIFQVLTFQPDPAKSCRILPEFSSNLVLLCYLFTQHHREACRLFRVEPLGLTMMQRQACPLLLYQWRSMHPGICDVHIPGKTAGINACHSPRRVTCTGAGGRTELFSPKKDEFKKN